MKIKLALATFVLATTVATGVTQAGESVPAAGFGSQYGDLGGKFTYRQDKYRHLCRCWCRWRCCWFSYSTISR